MNYIVALGAALKKVGSIQVGKEEIHDKLHKMATAIYNCPVRNKQKRDYETVLKCCTNIVGEYAAPDRQLPDHPHRSA